jgi:hypothetical protein
MDNLYRLARPALHRPCQSRALSPSLLSRSSAAVCPACGAQARGWRRRWRWRRGWLSRTGPPRGWSAQVPPAAGRSRGRMRERAMNLAPASHPQASALLEVKLERQVSLRGTTGAGVNESSQAHGMLQAATGTVADAAPAWSSAAAEIASVLSSSCSMDPARRLRAPQVPLQSPPITATVTAAEMLEKSGAFVP